MMLAERLRRFAEYIDWKMAGLHPYDRTAGACVRFGTFGEQNNKTFK